MDLGRLLIHLELYNDAIRVLNPVRSQPGAPAEAFGLLATALSSMGEMGHGYQVLLEGRRRSWQEPSGNSLLGDHLTRWGHFELATTYLDSANIDRPEHGMPAYVVDDLLARWTIHALQRDWVEAEQLSIKMLPLDDPRAKGAGTLRLALGSLFQGRSQLAGALAEEAALRFAQQDVDAGEALGTAVQVRFERNDATGALDLVRRVRRARAELSDPRVSFWEAVALGRLGRWTEADGVRRRLAQGLAGMPGPVGQRTLHHLDGEFSLLRGDARGGLSSLVQAAELLPPRGFCGDHVPIWHALARANLMAGKTEQATTWLQRIARCPRRLCGPSRDRNVVGSAPRPVAGRSGGRLPASRLWGDDLARRAGRGAGISRLEADTRLHPPKPTPVDD
jgi:tetratricopeptide (TPR) repeat protein